MQGKAKLLGHAIHPMLIGFPIALLGLTPFFDVAFLVTRNAFFGQLAYWLCAMGLLSGVVAAVPGLVDYLSVPANTRARRVGTVHLTLNLLALVLFFLGFLFRLRLGADALTWFPVVLSFLGLGVLAVGAWHGGELVAQHALSVRAHAHLNAPSSLDEERLATKPAPRPGTRPTEPTPA